MNYYEWQSPWKKSDNTTLKTLRFSITFKLTRVSIVSEDRIGDATYCYNIKYDFEDFRRFLRWRQSGWRGRARVRKPRAGACRAPRPHCMCTSRYYLLRAERDGRVASAPLSTRAPRETVNIPRDTSVINHYTRWK